MTKAISVVSYVIEKNTNVATFAAMLIITAICFFAGAR